MHSTRQALEQAVELHRGGNLDAAESLYRQVLEADARSADAWHLLGLIAHARGEHALAVERLCRAIELDDRRPEFHNHLADIYRQLARPDEARQSCQRALALKDDFALAHNTLGLIDFGDQRLEEAEACFRRAVGMAPGLAMAHFNLGLVLRARGRLDEAAAAFREALGGDAEMTQAYQELATILHEQGRLAEAIHLYREVLRRDARLAEVHCGLGSALQMQSQTEEAVRAYEAALALEPNLALAHYNLGVIYEKQDDFARAVACYQNAAAFDPGFAAALNNLGNLLKSRGRMAEADACYNQAAAADPSFAPARFNQAMNLLAEGNFAAGWPLFEWRWDCPEFTRRSFDAPNWQGESLAARTLLVYAEQGLGDTLQFARFLPLAAQRAGKVVFEVPRSLMRLLERSGLADETQWVAKGDPLPRFDAVVSIMTLPGILGTTPSSIPAVEGYLSADPQLVSQWRAKLGNAAKRRVGIAWQGNPEYRGDRFRSIPLAHFAALALPGVELVSLQKGFGAEQLAGVSFPVRDLGRELDEAHGAFMDTAVVIENLDLVVTSDTVIAHLAGALGARVWVALPVAPDWRWMLERSDSPWYAGMTLFRQTQFGDWAEVFRRIAAQLEPFLAARS